MATYNALVGNLRSPKYAIFQVYGRTADYQTMRWGLASSMLGDGYFCFTVDEDGTGAGLPNQPAWFDEFSVPIGASSEPAQSAPRTNGLWYRQYTRGMVISNPTAAPASIDLTGQGYYRIDASHYDNQDPAVNNGQLQTVVTVPSKDGLLLVKR